jgi:hypothetical protein
MDRALVSPVCGGLADECGPGWLLSGAFMYVQSDNQFKMNGVAAYSWAILYFIMICTEVRYDHPSHRTYNETDFVVVVVIIIIIIIIIIITMAYTWAIL